MCEKSVVAQQLNLVCGVWCASPSPSLLLALQLDPKTGQYIVDTTVSAADDLASTAGSEISQR